MRDTSSIGNRTEAIVLAALVSTGHRPLIPFGGDLNYRSYQGDVDLFGVYCPGTEEVYLVPIGDVPGRGASLRVAPTKNGSNRGVRWARDYVIWSKESTVTAFGQARSTDSAAVA